jgi:hypothetical protein
MENANGSGNAFAATGCCRITSRAVPIWGPIALILAVVVGFFPDRRLWSVIEFSLLLIGTSAIAWRIWTTSDEAWSHWEPAVR